MVQGDPLAASRPAEVLPAGALSERTSLELDVIRSLLALTVAVAHTIHIWLSPLLGDAHGLLIWSRVLASYAVNGFFVLSGFMIAFSVYRHRNPDGRFRTSDFFKARAFRVLPPYYFSVVLTVLIVVAINRCGLYGSQSYLLAGDQTSVRPRAEVNWSDCGWILTLSHGILRDRGQSLLFNGPLWTLSGEWFLYLFITIAAHGVSNRRVVSLFVALAFLGTVVILGARPFQILLAIWVVGFTLGSTAFHQALRAWNVLLVAVISAASFVALGADGYQYRMLQPYTSGMRTYLMFLCFAGLMASFMGLRILATRTSPIPRGLSAVASSASWSYTLYLIHVPILMLGLSLTRPMIQNRGALAHFTAGFFWLGAAILCSMYSARIIEDRARFRSGFERWMGRARLSPDQR
jgi:peptidoglycan/LPS O-acetylase OafA/YrhL